MTHELEMSLNGTTVQRKEQEFTLAELRDKRAAEKSGQSRKYFCATCGRIANTQERCHELLMVPIAKS